VTVKQRLKNTIKITVSGAKMSEESKEKALPGYKSLADTQKEQNSQTQNLISQNEIIILLLDRLCTVSEDLYLVTKCEKKATKKHRSKGLMFAVLITVIALVGESISKGESSIFITTLKFAKGLVL
jgi:hypothetical protein